jgi:hypothetical protein
MKTSADAGTGSASLTSAFGVADDDLARNVADDTTSTADCTAGGWESLRIAAAAEDDPADGRLDRMRLRVDVWLAEMVSDDPAQDSRQGGGDMPGPVCVPAGSDSGFWGPDESAEAKQASGYHSKHRLTGPLKEPRPAEGRRGKPRHAAPPAGFSASVADSVTRGVGRTVAAARLVTSRAARTARDRSGETAPAAGLGTRPAAVG